MDNLTAFSNRIHAANMTGHCLRLYRHSVRQPSILIKTLRDLGIPAKICKFIQNLVMEREFYFVRNGKLNNPLSTHKGMPSGS